MPTTIVYADIQNYLNAIAKQPPANNPISGSPHGAWWLNPDGSPLKYTDFLSGQIPNVGSVNIMDSGTPLQSAFYVILTNTNGCQGFPQMPGGGPFITDAGYTVTLSDGTKITGATIQANMESWLTNKFPEK